MNSAPVLQPDTNIGDPSFGQISGTADREFCSWALHFRF